jgi:hypothetical protein
MKRFLGFLIVFMFAFTLQATNYALVIGIGNYPDVDYGWPTIHGNNDISIVCEMLSVNGFKKENITTLCDSQATYDAILSAFKDLKTKLNKDDVVYIHFSGHGQRITDLNGDEFDKFDEAWIPYDALQEGTYNYNGEKHLTDDKLNKLLKGLRCKVGAKGKIVVVTDACHSGTATRHLKGIETTEIVRGISEVFYIEIDGVIYEDYDFYNEKFTEEELLKHSLEHPTEWVSIAACADNENNRQVTLEDGTRYGSLSYALYLLRYKLKYLTIKKLRSRLKEEVNRLIPRLQTPQIDFSGNENQYLFR